MIELRRYEVAAMNAEFSVSTPVPEYRDRMITSQKQNVDRPAISRWVKRNIVCRKHAAER